MIIVKICHDNKYHIIVEEKENHMIMSGKDHHKRSHRKLRKVLDKTDPFDQLIMELAQKGTLDVCVVEIEQASPIPEPQYSRKPIPYQHKYTS